MLYYYFVAFYSYFCFHWCAYDFHAWLDISYTCMWCSEQAKKLYQWVFWGLIQTFGDQIQSVYKLNVHTYRTVKHKANDYRTVVIMSGILFMWIKQTITWNEYTYMYANLSAISLLPVTSSHAGSTCVVEEWVGETMYVSITNMHLNTNSQLTLLDNSPIHMYGLVGGCMHYACGTCTRTWMLWYSSK